MQIREFHYRVSWRSRGSHPGYHRSGQTGSGVEFRHTAPLLQAPDPRRFDVHATLRDPFEQLMVRVYSQPGAIPVYVLADLSASLGFQGEQGKSKLGLMAEFIACLSYSAYRTGDPFGVIACDNRVREEFLLPPGRSKAAGVELGSRLQNYQPQGANSEGLLSGAELLAKRRALVFLISDFHFPVALLKSILDKLAYHDIVPVMLWDRAEYERLPAFGIVRIIDRENGRQRTLLMRPALQRKMQAHFAQRRQLLQRLFAGYGRMPLTMTGRFDADAVTRYFYGDGTYP
jgi:uncharacterized protein (DUF58 family)